MLKKCIKPHLIYANCPPPKKKKKEKHFRASLEFYLVVQVIQGSRGFRPHQVWCKGALGLVAVTHRLAITLHTLNTHIQWTHNCNSNYL